MSDDNTVVGDISLGVIFVIIFYFVLIDLNFNDKDLLMSNNVVSFVVKFPIVSGTIDLPGLNYSISIFNFFAFVPIFVVILHFYGLWVLMSSSREEVGAGARSELAATATIFTAPVALLIFAWSLSPFAKLQPDSEIAARYGLVLFLVALVALDLLVLLAFFPIWSGGRRRGAAISRGPLFVVASRMICVMSCVLLAVSIARLGQFSPDPNGDATIDSQTDRALKIAILIVGPVVGLATYGVIRPAWFVGIIRWSRPVVSYSGRVAAGRELATLGFFKTGRWRIPMHLRLTTTALALLAMAQVASSRAIDVSGQILAASMPSEAIIAAYVTGAWPEDKLQASKDAIRDNARGINLDRWHLRGAIFSNAMMPKVSLKDADLTGAIFDYADLFDANLSGANMTRARFRYVDFHNFMRVADAANFSGAILDGADFTGADLRAVNFETAHLTGADFTGADLREAIFKKISDVPINGPIPANVCNIESTDFLNEVIFTAAQLDKATLQGVDFTLLKDMKGAIITNAHLECSIFNCHSFDAIDFTGANLRGAKFIYTDVSDVSDDLTKRFELKLPTDDAATTIDPATTNNQENIKGRAIQKIKEACIKSETAQSTKAP